MSDPAVIEGICRKFEALNPVLDERSRTKELVEDFDNRGTEGRLDGDPEAVRVHDFKDKQLGEAIPYGVSDGGGSNSHRSRLWKVSLQELADEHLRDGAQGQRSRTCHTPTYEAHGAWNYTISPRK